MVVDEVSSSGTNAIYGTQRIWGSASDNIKQERSDMVHESTPEHVENLLLELMIGYDKYGKATHGPNFQGTMVDISV